MIQKCACCNRPVLAKEGTCPFCVKRGRPAWMTSLVAVATPMVLAACYGDAEGLGFTSRVPVPDRGVCGDGECTVYVDEILGPQQEDCPEECALWVCGDGVCSESEGGWETATTRQGITCWEDCAVCGDGVCAQFPPGTLPEACPADCEQP